MQTVEAARTYRRYRHEIALEWTEPGLLTVAYAARLLGLSPTALDQRIRRHRVWIFRIGDTRFVHRDQLAELRRLGRRSTQGS